MKTYDTYRQGPGACNELGECLEPGWYWVRVREAGYGYPPSPYGLEVGPFKTKRDADREACKALRCNSNLHLI